MSPPNLDPITALFHAHLTKESESNFPKLTLTPSSLAVKLLDYIAALTPAARDALLAAFARLNAMRFFTPNRAIMDQMRDLAATDPALLHYRAALQSPSYAMGLRYCDLRMKKAMLSDPVGVEMIAKTRAALDFTPRDDPPPALIPDPANANPAKAPQLRKLIEKAFKDLFAPSKEKSYGETAYNGRLHNTEIKVWVDFAAMGLQLRYGVSIPDESRRVYAQRLAYEDFWGFGTGWDYITEENTERSVNLLCDHIQQIVTLRNSVLAALQ